MIDTIETERDTKVRKRDKRETRGEGEIENERQRAKKKKRELEPLEWQTGARMVMVSAPAVLVVSRAEPMPIGVRLEHIPVDAMYDTWVSNINVNIEESRRTKVQHSCRDKHQ